MHSLFSLGFEIIESIARVETGAKDKPIENVTVVNCGELVRAGKVGGGGAVAPVRAGEESGWNWTIDRAEVTFSTVSLL